MKEVDAKTLSKNLIKKVKRKCQKYLDSFLISSEETNSFSIIIHGHFVRSKILFKHNYDKPCDAKIVGWQTVKYDSPSIDFGSILITNLPKEPDVSKLVSFYRNMLRFYLKNVTIIYPEITRKDLERNIIKNLLFSYIYHHHAIKQIHTHKMVLETFDKLGGLD